MVVARHEIVAGGVGALALHLVSWPAPKSAKEDLLSGRTWLWAELSAALR